MNNMVNTKKSKAKKSKAKKQQIKKSKVNNPSFEPDVIEKDVCTLFSEEWTKNAGKITGLIMPQLQWVQLMGQRFVLSCRQ